MSRGARKFSYFKYIGVLDLLLNAQINAKSDTVWGIKSIKYCKTCRALPKSLRRRRTRHVIFYSLFYTGYVLIFYPFFFFNFFFLYREYITRFITSDGITVNTSIKRATAAETRSFIILSLI